MSTQHDGSVDVVDAVVLAFMIADIRGYSRFSRERGDAAAAALAKRFADLARDAVEARSGSVVELRGDEVFAAFPTAALAAQAGVELQLSCVEETQRDPSLPLLVGIGIDVGPAVPVEDGYRGIAINLAARLCSSAGAGQVLMTATAAEQLQGVSGDVEVTTRGSSTFKGFDEPISIVEAHARCRPVSVEDMTTAGEPLPPDLVDATPLIGRTHEMRWMRGTWRQVRRGRGRVLVIDGRAGIGKTRLAAEIGEHVRRFGALTRFAGPGGVAAATALSVVSEARTTQSPSLIVIDQVDVIGPEVIDAIEGAVADIADRPALLLLLLRDPSGSPRLAKLVERCSAGGGHRRLSELSPAEVGEIVAVYAGDSADEAPVEMIVRASRGIPALVHEQASEWARSETARRLEAAASFMAAARERRTADLEFANNVISLKLGQLYAPDNVQLAPEIEALGPYKGLAAFGQDDAAWFFGREQLVGELAARIVASGALAIVGASGSGKSSVVAAGLLPSLHAGLLPGSNRWSQAAMRPSDQPMAALRSTLGRPDDDPIDAAIERLDDGGRLVLIVDQLEEVFAACDSEASRQQFLHLLAMHATQHADQFAVIVAVRSDFYGHLAEYPAFAGLVADNHVLVGPLSRAELQRAVQLPAQRARVRIESALVESLVDEAVGEPGALPLLSTALVELWQARSAGWIRMAAYRDGGGIRGAVARLAEASYAQLDEADRSAARRVLLRLAATGDSEALIRRRVELAEFDLDRDVSARRVIERFTADRLLTVSGSTAEVAHEALLREWPRLRTWLEEDMHGRRLQQHLTLAAKGWDAAGRERSEVYRGARLTAALEWAGGHQADLNDLERTFLNASREASEAEADRVRRSNRRLRRIAVALAAVVLLAVAGGVIALVERGNARTQARRAEAAALSADARRLAALSANAPDVAAASRLALAAYRLDDTPDTRAALLAAVERTTGALWRIQYREPVFDVIAGKDGSRVALREGDRVVIVDPRTRTQIASFRSRGIQIVGFTNDGNDVVSFQTNEFGAKDAGSLYVQAVPSGRLVRQLSDVGNPTGFQADNVNEPATLAVSSYGGRWIALATTTKVGNGVVVQVFDSADWNASPRTFVTIRPPVAMEASATALAVEHADGSVEVRALSSLKPIGELPAAPHTAAVTIPSYLVAVSPDGSEVARSSLTDSFHVTIYDLHHPKGAGVALEPVPNGAVAMQFSPDGAHLAIGSSGGKLTVYRSQDGSVATSFLGNRGELFRLAWAGRNAASALYSVGIDGELISWDVDTQPRLLHENGPTYPDMSDAVLTNVSLNGSRSAAVLSGTSIADLTSVVLDVDSGVVTQFPLRLGAKVVCCLSSSVSSDGRVDLVGVPLAAAKGSVVGPSRNEVWDTQTHKLVWNQFVPSTGAQENFLGIVTPDGQRAYLDLTQKRIAVYALPSGKLLRTIPVQLPGSNTSIAAVPWAMDPSGRLLVYRQQAPANNKLGLVDPSSGRVLAQVQLGDILTVMSQAWSNDGRLLAVGTYTGTLFILDAKTLAIRAKLNGAEPGSVDSISFSPDDRTVVTTGHTGQINFWSVAGLESEAHVTIGDGVVYAWYTSDGRLVGFAPDPAHPNATSQREFTFAADPASLVTEACTLGAGGLTKSGWQHDVGDQPYRKLCP